MKFGTAFVFPRRYFASVLALAVVGVSAVIASPAAAEPPVVPDDGARPPAAATAGADPAQPATAPVLSPLAQQIRAETAAVQALEQRLTQLSDDVVRLGQDAESKQRAWNDSREALEQARARADENAVEALKAARRLGPMGVHADELRKLGKLMPAVGQLPGAESIGRDLSRARAVEEERRAAAEAAAEALQAATASRDGAKAAYDAKKAALADLMARNASQLPGVQAQEDAYESAAGAQLGAGEQVAGMVADPRALAAVRHALRQLGKPYEWAAEGPNSYDCSGLIWDAYRTVGVSLPRVAAYQYNATTKIQVDALLPGDLLFFGPRGPWTGISHMGMYIGGGKMVQAPTTGDVVKVSTPRWSNFYGATRVLRAVPAPAAPPPSTAPPSSSPPVVSPPPSSSSPPTSPSWSTSPSPSTSGTQPAPSVSSGSTSPSRSPSRSPSGSGPSGSSSPPG